MQLLTDLHTRSIRLTAERRLHLETMHPEMVDQVLRVAETLANPDTIVRSRTDEMVELFYKHYPSTPVTDKFLCTVVKALPDDPFIITAYYTHADLIQQVQHTSKDRTAGDPMREDVAWTDVTPQEISDRLQAQAVCAGPRIVRRMLDTLGLARRQRAKVLPGGDSPHRDAQFRHLAHLIHEFLEAGNPVLSIDTKKTECLGTLSRDGKGYCQQALKAFDHDFPSLASGVIIPHGLYDLARNQGWIHVGLSRDTTAFACESLRVFWHSDGGRLDPNASALLLLCDGGGRNSGHKHLFKEDLQDVVNDLEVPIRVAHYPAYGSKGNPIERRLFSHVTRACQGGLFDSLQTVLGLIQKTKTPQGLSVTVRVLDKLYEGGRTVSEAFKKHMPIVFDSVLPKWNYWAVPQ